MKRGPRGSGIHVDPLRVREARQEAGLSLAQVAGAEVSRTFIHFVEQGRSRPSRAVLSLIARRTKKPMSYFLQLAVSDAEPANDLAAELVSAADHVRRLVSKNRLPKVEREAMKLLELTLLQGAHLTKSIQAPITKGSKRPKTLTREH